MSTESVLIISELLATSELIQPYSVEWEYHALYKRSAISTKRNETKADVRRQGLYVRIIISH